MQIKTSRKGGFTLVEIMIVVAIIGLLAAIAIPNFVKARKTSAANACINNLRQLNGAKQQYALEHKMGAAYSPSSTDILPYLSNTNTMPNCPLDSSSYTLNVVDTPPTCANSSTSAAVGDIPHLTQ